MARQTLLALSLAALLLIGVESAVFTITNNCPMTIWPAAFTGSGSQPSTTGFALASRATSTINFPSPGLTSGRIWARTFCTDRCVTGDCGRGGGPCSGATGVPPATLVEFTLNANGRDTYDVSNVDGFNLRVSVAPENPACQTTNCLGNINDGCPADLVVRGPNGNAGCKSDCAAFNRAQDCCTGAFASANTCRPSRSAMYFKGKCPRAYSYAFDDPSSLFNCPTGTNYRVTFCP